MPLDRFFQDLLMLDQWSTCSPAESEEIAQDLDRALPTSFRFHKVETCALGDQKHQVAFFEWDGPPEGYDQACFALIPGGTVTLGYDRAHPFVPTRYQQQSWMDETETYFHLSLDDFLDQMMTPLRRVTIHPFLLEVRAKPLESPPIFHPEWGPKGGYEHAPCTILMRKPSSTSPGPVFVFQPLTNGNTPVPPDHARCFAGGTTLRPAISHSWAAEKSSVAGICICARTPLVSSSRVTLITGSSVPNRESCVEEMEGIPCAPALDPSPNG